MKIVRTLICLLIFVAFGIFTVLSLEAQQPDRLPFEVIGQNNVRSGWSREVPGIAIVANPDESMRFYNLVSGNDYAALRRIDYDSSFAVAVFYGLRWNPQDSQTSAVNVEQIQREGNQIHITATSTLIPLDDDTMAISPYQIIKIDKADDWDEEIAFALQLDDQDVITTTHDIANPDLDFEAVERFSSGNIGDRQSLWESEAMGNIVVATPDELSALQTLVPTETMQTLQAVDYEKQFVIGLFQGWKPSAGYAIEIEQIRHQLGTLAISALITELAEGEGAPTIETSPYHIVKVDKMPWWNRELTFTVLSGEQPLLTQTHAVPNHDIEFERVHSGEELWWEEDTPGLMVVNTVSDAQRLKTLIDLESIDYNEYFLIAQFFQFSSGGYNLSMNPVRYAENRLSLYHNLKSPYIGDRVTTVIYSPYNIIKIPRSARAWNREIDIGILFNGTTRLTQTHTILPPSEMTTIEKNGFVSGWTSPDPHMEIIATIEDISKVEEFISTETVTALQELDYQEKYAAIVFQGEKTTTEYEVEIEQVRRSGNQVILDSLAITPTGTVGLAITSPYHLVQIDNLYERGRQVDFVLNINDQNVMTQTRSIPDILPQSSTLQGNFYPLTDTVGYEIVLENQGQQTAENVRLLVQTEYNDVEYADDWNCNKRLSPQECRQDLGDLSAGQVITRTFSFAPLALPLIRATQSCRKRTEYAEPVVTAWADGMAVHQLGGTGESVFAYVTPGVPCVDRLFLPLIVR